MSQRIYYIGVVFREAVLTYFSRNVFHKLFLICLIQQINFSSLSLLNIIYSTRLSLLSVTFHIPGSIVRISSALMSLPWLSLLVSHLYHSVNFHSSLHIIFVQSTPPSYRCCNFHFLSFCVFCILSQLHSPDINHSLVVVSSTILL